MTQVQPISFQTLLEMSKKEDTACWRVSHARSLSTRPQNLENMVLPRPPLWDWTSSPTRSTRTPGQPLPMWESLLFPKRSMKWQISTRRISLSRWSRMTELLKLTSGCPEMSNCRPSCSICGNKKEMMLRFSSMSLHLVDKRKLFQAESKNDHSLFLSLISFTVSKTHWSIPSPIWRN